MACENCGHTRSCADWHGSVRQAVEPENKVDCLDAYKYDKPFDDLKPAKKSRAKKTQAKEMWLCGRVIGDFKGDVLPWAFHGIFSTEKKAEKECIDDTFFIFPVTLDEQLPLKLCVHPRARYPHTKIEKEKI